MTTASSARGVLAATVSLLLSLPLTARCYNIGRHHRVVRGRTVSTPSSALFSATDAVHFEKFDLTHLPDAMVNSTVWVGNLNEFVTDHELGRLFAKGGGASPLNVPAVVARRPNNDSLRYGVVHFHTSADAQAAVDKFDGFVYQGLPMKIQLFRDSTQARAKVPEKLVSYVLGSKNNPFTGAPNKLRRISGEKDLSSRRRPNKRSGSTKTPRCLSDREQLALDRALEHGFVTLDSTGYRRGRKGSPLANAHREWCDARGKPQIIVCKASGGRPQDNVVVDLSPLRTLGIGTEALRRRTSEVLAVAERNGMALNDDILEDNTVVIDSEGCAKQESRYTSEYRLDASAEAWTRDPISKRPAVSLGVFEGQRCDAKSMAKELAVMWNVLDTARKTGKRTKPPRTTFGTNGRGKGASSTKGGRHARNKGHKTKRRKNVELDFSTW